MSAAVRSVRLLLVVVVIATTGGFVSFAEAGLHLAGAADVEDASDGCCPPEDRCPSGDEDAGCPPLCDDCVRTTVPVSLASTAVAGVLLPPEQVLGVEPWTRVPPGPPPPGVFHPPRPAIDPSWLS